MFFLFIFAEIIAVTISPTWRLHAKDAREHFHGSVQRAHQRRSLLTLACWSGHNNFKSCPAWAWTTLIACFVLDDLRYYLHHRIAHRCRWPWAMHIIHHSSQHVSFAVACGRVDRYFTSDGFKVRWCSSALTRSWSFSWRTERDASSFARIQSRNCRWFEAIFMPITPRVHHGKNPQY